MDDVLLTAEEWELLGALINDRTPLPAWLSEALKQDFVCVPLETYLDKQEKDRE